VDDLNDIKTIIDIKTLVNTFYDNVRGDDLIGPIFNDAIQDRWPIHLEKMY
jgi:hemoglobin